MATGRVTSFDPDKGWGEVAADADGAGERYWFHLTAVADGSRHIDVGTPVTFAVVAGQQGRWEASDLSPLS